jgi:signal transduction histidine kinase/DNA-binding response OmpR family regulator
VALLDDTGERLVGRAAAGYGREIIEQVGGGVPVGEGLVGWVVENREPALVRDVRQDSRYMPSSPKTMSEMVVPLVVGDRVVGVVDVESTQLNAFSEDDLRLLLTLSGSLSAIIQNAQLLDEIQAANEQLRELDQMKTQFLANMSHELRTPLNSIIGFSRVILKGIDGPLTDLQEQDLETIYSSGQHLLGLINDVLDMSKFEAGKLDLTREAVRLEEVVEGVMSTAAALVKDKAVELVTNLPPDLPDITGDSMRIRQVLLNLLSNAAKFTHEGSITVGAEVLEETGTEPARVQVSVTDTGIGIQEDDMDKLFEAFSQVDASTTRQAGGTGLGLSISRSLVDLHGGRIWVESEVGVGSTFSFTIPLHPQPTQMEPIPDLALDTGDKPIVLAIDDDESVLSLYRRYVESEGMALVALTSGHNVADVVQQIEPVAVILDVMMPGRDGWEVLADLKLNPYTKDVPVILCTIVEEQQRAFRLGAVDYLVKPILKEDMVAALRRLQERGDGQATEQHLVEEVVEEQPLPMPEPGPSRSVLVIDDDERLADLVREGLQENGAYAVRTASNGQAGLAAITEEKPDLIILNLLMPDIDGFQVLARLDGNPVWRDIPVLLLTAKDLTPEDYDRLTDQAVSMINKEAHDQSELLDTIAHAVASM